MKKHAKMSVKRIIFKIMGLFLIVLVFIGAFGIVVLPNKNGILYQKLQAGRVPKKYVLELWNVDTFEGGTGSKSGFLESVALEFEKRNKGIFVLVRNMEPEEMESRLALGEMPDMFSFSRVVAKRVQGFLTELEENTNVREVLISSGKTSQNELLCLPWCMSGYAIMSSGARLGETTITDPNLFSDIYNLGFEKTLKKSTKVVCSVAFGEKKGHAPERAIVEEAKIKGVSFSKNNLSVLSGVRNLTPYGAYHEWAVGHSVALVGTARDLVRLETREKSGKEANMQVYCLSYFTDMVQYIGVTKVENSEKQKYSEAFSNLLTSECIQEMISSIGLFPVLSSVSNLYESGGLSVMEKALHGLSCVENIFE